MRSAEELHKELVFMYGKYEELCKAYKKLAQNTENNQYDEVHDMSHMTFSDEISENREENK